ncbi:glycoside hydrolase [Dacryopinax primogenitus]|uniref:glucan endo-1,3-beta-D-glucosidase n=1 Tax=Dacryopinax primogenitus (strain DJM 731) TaxID=1858805 RepID=M5GG85_DACPD|nr:glycoside hydrolase [Dacryopinax primogenitus]EJU05048.1 glycoside hydrolase [Dacryopinax primogenitus]
MAHRSTPSEALPLKQRMHEPRDPDLTAAAAAAAPGSEANIDPHSDPDVSPFADPGAASANPFSDPLHAPVSAHLQDNLGHSNSSPYEEEFTQIPGPETPTPAQDPDDTFLRRRLRRRKWIIGGAVIFVIITSITLSTTLGIVFGGRSDSSSSSSTPTNTLSGTVGAVTFTDPSNPSTYVPDSNLHNSFYGIDYVPFGAYAPECGISQNNVTEDVVLLSQLTTRVRTYSAQCGQAGMILEGIKQTGVHLGVYLAVNLTMNETALYEETSALAQTLEQYGTANVLGVIVGNQFITSYLSEHNTTDPASQPGQNAAGYVSSQLASMRATLSALNLSHAVPVGIADGANVFTPSLLGEVDFFMQNGMPYRSNVSLQNAAQWTMTTYSSTTSALSNTTHYIGETGWPSSVLPGDTQEPTATPQSLQTFLDGFVCQANGNETGYFWYEAFDELWREGMYGGAEGGWGVFTSDKKLKNVLLPNCSHV